METYITALSICIALLIYLETRRYETAKEKLRNLYNPLSAIILKSEKRISFLQLRDEKLYGQQLYQLFLDLRDIYLGSSVYASANLRLIFNHLHHNHEMEYHNLQNSKIQDHEVLPRLAEFELGLRSESGQASEFEQKMEELFETVLNDECVLLARMRPLVGWFYR